MPIRYFKTVACNLDTEMFKRFSEKCIKEHTNKSEVLRKAIKQYVEEKKEVERGEIRGKGAEAVGNDSGADKAKTGTSKKRVF